MSGRDLGDLALHALGGAVLALPFVPWQLGLLPPWLLPAPLAAAWALWGLLREQAQHAGRVKGAREGPPGNPSWWGWATPHKLLEGAAWAIGPLITLGLASAIHALV